MRPPADLAQARPRSSVRSRALVPAWALFALLATVSSSGAVELSSASYRHSAGAVSTVAAGGGRALSSAAAEPSFGPASLTIGTTSTVEPSGSSITLASLLPGFWAIAIGSFPTLDLDGDLLQFFLDPDDDGDGLEDAVETGTGFFVSETNTGTSPTTADSDRDGLLDGEEVLLGSDPNDELSPGPSARVPGLTPFFACVLVLSMLMGGIRLLDSRRRQPLC